MRLRVDANDAHRLLTQQERDALCDWLEAETPEHRNMVTAITLGEGVVTCECYVEDDTDPRGKGRLVDWERFEVVRTTRTHAVRTLPPVWPR